MPTSQRLLTSLALTATALGALTLTACGTQGAGGRAAAAAVTASPSPRMLSGEALERHPDPVVRAQAIAIRITNTCAPGTAMELPPVPEVDTVAETVAPPAAGEPPVPEEPPVPAGEPLEFPSDMPPPPGPEATVSFDEVPLNAVDRCAADAYADRVRAAFAGGAPADEAALRKTLTGLDHLPDTVHRMPGDGPLRVRVDLRDLSPNDNLALEVTATATGVRVDAFGAPLPGGPDITGIVRERS
ncbi:hypothetical protein ACFVU3_07830 [Streptomyces sp. NPDC058052]|uniref:hypothetical protein n=1 Tax=Streptomyces sp. NPDC058052 TaxID=3346316 RepID=UPI0036EA542E